MKNLFFVSLSIMALILNSCDDEGQNLNSKVISTSIKNLPADTVTGFGPMGEPLGTTNHFTFFRLSDSSIVQLQDSATTKWDIAFRGSSIIINSGTSGPGQAGAFLYNGLFSTLLEVPTDSIFKIDNSPTFSIGKGWYSYDPVTMILSATPGKIIVFRTTEAKYAKLEILSYYKNAPASPNAFKDLPRYFTFRYVYQENGSKSFE